MRKIAHIVNPVAVPKTSDLYVAQPITFESMLAARRFASETVAVELLTAQFPEDRAIIPDGFIITRDLDRSVLDFGTFHKPRKLPLMGDILNRLHESTDADYLIYTNADIALMPSFYATVDALINVGFDAFVINRRTIQAHYKDIGELPLMYAEIGQPHPGYDCFVFKRSSVPEFALEHVCIGAPKIGLALVANMACTATRFQEFSNAVHLTFHIGNDRTWASTEFQDYVAHNTRETERIRTILSSRYDGRTLPTVGQEPVRQFFEQIRQGKTSGPNG